LFANTVFNPTLSVLESVYGLWNDSIGIVSGVTGLQYSMNFQRIPTYITGNTNSLGLSPENGPLTLFQMSVTWKLASDDALVKNTVQNLIASVKKCTKKAGVFNSFKYLNYAASFQDPLSGYGPASEAKLTAASKKYDPTGVFQIALPGGFKLRT
jgi:hypothetical protein